MKRRILTAVGVYGLVLLFGAAVPLRADDNLEEALHFLRTYDWGEDGEMLQPFYQAVADACNDTAAARELETRLSEVLKEDVSRAAKVFVCRRLSLVASSASVPIVATLLPEEELSHMARYVLERVPGEEAAVAMVEALGQTSGSTKVGIINSLGARREKGSLGELARLLADPEQEVVAAAAAALGSIGTGEAATALGGFLQSAPEGTRNDVAHAYLLCADRLLGDGNRAQALAIYRAVVSVELPGHITIAATRGLLSASTDE